jgi:CelD/BcsL family acetyltransferase involved in cellulose biosynthesis
MAISIQSLDRAVPEHTGPVSRTADLLATRRTTPDLEFALITTRAGFDALEADWNDLFDRIGRSIHLFQTFNWNWHWANHYLETSDQHELAIATVRRRGRLVMLWPMVVERTAGLKVLAWMGAPVSQYGDILAEDGPACLPAMREAWAFLLASVRPDAVKLNKTRSDSTVAPLLAELGTLVTQQLEAPYLDLASAPTYAQYEERYSSKDRKNRRRLYRRLEETGAVTIQTCGEGPEAAAAASTAIAMKRTWLEHKGFISPAVSDARFARFFAAAARSTERPAGLVVSAITCDGKPAAMEIAIACRERIAAHILVYDTAFDKFGPGGLMLEKLLAARLAAGTAVYDMLAPGGGYKSDWADGSVAVCDHALGCTVKGKLYARGFLGLLRPRLKRLAEGLPIGWRRFAGRKLIPKEGLHELGRMLRNLHVRPWPAR